MYTCLQIFIDKGFENDVLFKETHVVQVGKDTCVWIILLIQIIILLCTSESKVEKL